MTWGGLSALYGPVVAFSAMIIIMLLLRWTYKRGGSLVERSVRPSTPDDYGMLVPVAAPGSMVEGELLRSRLVAAGVHATLAMTVAGPRLLVWPSDVERARSLL